MLNDSASSTPESHPTELPRVIGPYSSCVPAAGLLFLSGQVGKQPSTTTVGGGISEQTSACVQNMLSVLESEGLDASDLVKCTVYLVDIDDFGAMNEAYEAALGEHRPARTTVAVAALPLRARVEIEAIAALRNRPSTNKSRFGARPQA